MSDTTATNDAGATTTKEWYGWYVVFVLILAYTVSYVDRTILTLMVKPIRESLQISDTQVSLLHGLAFAIFYTGLGIPLGRMADRMNRTRIIMGGIVIWSLMTATCGLARNFGQLFLARVGVGVGEAALTPSAYSILSDYFKGPRLTRALSIYTSAIYIGAGLALIIGGAVIAAVPALDIPGLGHFQPWQVVFLCVGLPGIFVALLMLTVREPARTGLSPAAAAGQGIPLRDVAAFLWQRRGAYGFLILGCAAHSMLWNGATAWIPQFFIRVFEWSAPVTGFRFGLMLLVFGTGGILFGSVLSNYFRQRFSDANVMVVLASSLLVIPFGVLAPSLTDPAYSLMAFCAFVFTGSLPYGAAAAAFQEITPNQMRGQVVAVYFLFLNLAGIGLGPTIVALFTDHVFHDDLAVGKSLMMLALIAAPLSAVLLWAARRPYRKCLADMNLA